MKIEEMDDVMNELFKLPKDDELEIMHEGKQVKIKDLDEVAVKKILCAAIKKELIHRNMVSMLVHHFVASEPAPDDPAIASFVPGPGPDTPQ